MHPLGRAARSDEGFNVVFSPIAGDGDGAMAVGAKDTHVVLGEGGEHAGMRVPVRVARAGGNNTHFGLNPLNKVGVGRCPAAVVSHLQDVGTKVVDMRGQPLFGGVLDVAGQENAHLTVLQAQHQRSIVFGRRLPGRRGDRGRRRVPRYCRPGFLR